MAYQYGDSISSGNGDNSGTVQQQWMHDHTSRKGILTGFIPGYGIGRQLASQSAWKSKRSGARDAAMRTQLMNQQNALEFAYQQRQREMADQREAREGVRAQALSQVDQAYAAPSREAGYTNAYDTRLNDSMVGINQNYQYGSQQAGLAAAKRGRLGSSTDAEHQAALRSSLQLSTAGATTDAQSYSDAMRANDYAQHEALRNAILSGDPQTAAQYQQMAAQSNQQSGQLSQQSAFIDQNRALGQQYGNAYSQQLGGYGNAGANYVNSYYQSQGNQSGGNNGNYYGTRY